MEDFRIVTFGASLGGLNVLKKIFSSLDDNLPAAYFVVQHTSPEHQNILDQLLANYTSMPVHRVDEAMKIYPNHVYVSTSDKHLIFDKEMVNSVNGPRHNSSRPSVDVLFYSAALAYGSRVISVVLTGLLFDGAKGFKDVIERCGITIVQNPDEADCDEMPRSALRQNEVDYVAMSNEIAPLLGVLCRKKPAALPTVDEPSQELLKKVELAQSPAMEIIDKEQHLSEKNDDLEDGKEVIFNSLWSVVRLMQERSNMLENLAAGEYIKQRDHLAKRYQEKAMETINDTLNLRKLLHQYTIVKKNEAEKSPTNL